MQESTFEQVIKFLRVNDDAVKTNCFKLLLNILSRIFEKAPTNEFKIFEMGMLSSNNTKMSKDDEQELQQLKVKARESCFGFASQIVKEVISRELTFTDQTITGTNISDFANRPRLGLMRLSAIELLDKLQLSYGIRMLDVIKEADLFPSLLQMYALYPYNDIALRHVTNLISFALDPALAKTLSERSAPPKRPSRILDLEPISTLD